MTANVTYGRHAFRWKMKKQNVRTLSFIFSTFTYLLVGAAIFDALESQTEEATLKRLVQNENEVKTRFNISNDEWVQLEDLMKNIHLSPTQTFSSFLNQSSPQWKFTGAFYFSLTVITTIGEAYQYNFFFNLFILTYSYSESCRQNFH